MNGARDEFGNIPVKPDLQPNVIGFIAFDQNLQRIDTIRQNGIVKARAVEFGRETETRLKALFFIFVMVSVGQLTAQSAR